MVSDGGVQAQLPAPNHQGVQGWLRLHCLPGDNGGQVGIDRDPQVPPRLQSQHPTTRFICRSNHVDGVT